MHSNLTVPLPYYEFFIEGNIFHNTIVNGDSINTIDLTDTVLMELALVYGQEVLIEIPNGWRIEQYRSHLQAFRSENQKDTSQQTEIETIKMYYWDTYAP